LGEFQPRDLGALEKSVNDTAGKVSVLWTSFTLLGVYLAITTASITHRDLLLNTPIKMPVLGVDLPVSGYFMVAPIVYFVSHLYLCLQLARMAHKVDGFQQVLLRNVPLTSDRRYARLRLDNFPFVQLLAHGDDAVFSDFRATTVAICWMTGTLAPLLVLGQLLLAYLPNHGAALTWLHRACVLLDLALAWAIWATLLGRRPGRWPLTWQALAMTGSLAVVAFVCALAVFPSERLYDNPVRGVLDSAYARLDRDKSTLTQALFEGDVDSATGGSTSLFSNRLVLPDADFHEDGRSGAPIKPVTLRKRDLREAIFRRADLRRIDFTGADLIGASFSGADLRGAVFDCTDLESIRGYRDAQRARKCTKLQTADFSRAKLQGALFYTADLRGADFLQAALQGAFIIGGDLRATDFSSATLQGARLVGVDLTAARFYGANLMAVDFRGSTLNGAFFDLVELQGADLNWLRVSEADFFEANFYRTRVSRDFFPRSTVRYSKASAVVRPYVATTAINARPHPRDLSRQADYEDLVADALEGVEDKATLEMVRERLGVLAPDRRPDTSDRRGWIVLGAGDASNIVDTPQARDEERLKHQAELISRLACNEASAPYILRGIINNGRISMLLTESGDWNPPLRSDTCPTAKRLSADDRRRLAEVQAERRQLAAAQAKHRRR
jgi:uncharacterized protein YjbI with pentapeptide repeats